MELSNIGSFSTKLSHWKTTVVELQAVTFLNLGTDYVTSPFKTHKVPPIALWMTSVLLSIVDRTSQSSRSFPQLLSLHQAWSSSSQYTNCPPFLVDLSLIPLTYCSFAIQKPRFPSPCLDHPYLCPSCWAVRSSNNGKQGEAASSPASRHSLWPLALVPRVSQQLSGKIPFAFGHHSLPTMSPCTAFPRKCYCHLAPEPGHEVNINESICIR